MSSRGPDQGRGDEEAQRADEDSRPAAHAGIDSWKNTRQKACTPSAPALPASGSRASSAHHLAACATASGSHRVLMAKIHRAAVEQQIGRSSMPSQRASPPRRRFAPAARARRSFLTRRWSRTATTPQDHHALAPFRQRTSQ